MTHIALTLPANHRRIQFPALTVPRLGLGGAVVKLGRAYGETLSVACFVPGRPDSLETLPDPELEGRDPRW